MRLPYYSTTIDHLKSGSSVLPRLPLAGHTSIHHAVPSPFNFGSTQSGPLESGSSGSWRTSGLPVQCKVRCRGKTTFLTNAGASACWSRCKSQRPGDSFFCMVFPKKL
jgi:hypothetical protein